MARAQARACPLFVMPGKRRRSSTAAENSPPASKAARIAAASDWGYHEHGLSMGMRHRLGKHSMARLHGSRFVTRRGGCRVGRVCAQDCPAVACSIAGLGPSAVPQRRHGCELLTAWLCSSSLAGSRRF
jgi:hypothetical protein